MAKQSGKIRALRVRLDYHKHRGGLYWSRWACALFALLVSGGYGIFVLAGVFAPPVDSNAIRSSWLGQAAFQVNTGLLSQVHAHFEQDCMQCHSLGLVRPIAADALKLTSQATFQDLADKCQRCHEVQSHVAAMHSPTCREMDQNCSACHQDHLGRNVRLTSIANSRCTNCHSNLNKVCDGVSDLNTQTNIDNFSIATHATQAGTFRSLAADSGRIRFSHRQHMNPGQIKSGRVGGFERTMLNPRWQAHYADDLQGLVQLKCSDCHRLQAPSGNVGFENLDSLTSATDLEHSHNYAPIDFDQHCAACHQLTFTGQTSEMLPLPHAAPRIELQQLLSAKLLGGAINGAFSLPRDQIDDSGTRIASLINEQLSAAVERVILGCAKCHFPEDLTDTNTPAGHAPTAARPMIRPRWLQYGLFDHAAHKKISNCTFCHEIPNSEAPNDNAIVMIKGPESCTPCHRDAREPNATETVFGNSVDLSSDANRMALLGDAKQLTLASDNCVLCHRYHWSRPPVTNASISPANVGVPR